MKEKNIYKKGTKKYIIEDKDIKMDRSCANISLALFALPNQGHPSPSN